MYVGSEIMRGILARQKWNFTTSILMIWRTSRVYQISGILTKVSSDEAMSFWSERERSRIMEIYMSIVSLFLLIKTNLWNRATRKKYLLLSNITEKLS